MGFESFFLLLLLDLCRVSAPVSFIIFRDSSKRRKENEPHTDSFSKHTKFHFADKKWVFWWVAPPRHFRKSQQQNAKNRLHTLLCWRWYAPVFRGCYLHFLVRCWACAICCVSQSWERKWAKSNSEARTEHRAPKEMNIKKPTKETEKKKTIFLSILIPKSHSNHQNHIYM